MEGAESIYVQIPVEQESSEMGVQEELPREMTVQEELPHEMGVQEELPHGSVSHPTGKSHSCTIWPTTFKKQTPWKKSGFIQSVQSHLSIKVTL